MRHSWFAIGLCIAAANAQAGPVPTEPFLRIETGGQHTAPIRQISVDAAGRWLVTASDDKTARVWDLSTGTLFRILRPPIGPGNEGKLNAAAISPDGAVVALGGWTQFHDGKKSTSSDGHALYLMVRTGRMLRVLTGLPNVVKVLAFSPDGSWLAAGLGGTKGLRVWRTSDWQPAFQDGDFADAVLGLDFHKDGSLAASSDDGDVRLYRRDASGFKRTARQPATGGRKLLSVAFSPDGRQLALGFSDIPAVNVFDTANLRLLFSPDVSGAGNGSLGSVAWTPDGRLSAAGRWEVSSSRMMRIWEQGGRGRFRDVPVSSDSVMDLCPLPDGRVAFGSSDPAWGLIDATGRRTDVVPSSRADFRDAKDALRIAGNGFRVRFAYELAGKSPAGFDVSLPGLVPDDPGGLSAPRTEGPGLSVTGWKNNTSPKLNGRPLALKADETSRSLAVHPGGQGLVLGTSWSLRRFDAEGREVWMQSVPGTAWVVNVSADGRMVVAGYGDGTIRWHRWSDGGELLALFPHADQRRWVAWTPSGYYAAGPGSEELIGWHLNRGQDQAADFFPASRFRDRFGRQDVVQRVLTTLDEAEAVRLADEEAGRKRIAALVADVLPPVVDIVSPRDGEQVSEDRVTLRYSVRTPADAPVTALRVRVDGQPVSIEGTRGVTVTARDPRALVVPIPRRDCKIQVFAESRHGISVPATVRVVWAGSRDEFQAKPRLYVLAIGVSVYGNPDLRLKFAAKDAKDFAATMKAQEGRLYHEVAVKLLTDDQATRDEIVDGLDWLQKQVTQHDVGVLFLAGHGVNAPDYAFLPVNADLDKIKRTTVGMAEIRDTLNQLAGKAVFFVDTCHAGNVLGTGRRGIGTDMTAVVNELSSAENGVVVFSSSTGREFSVEDEKWGNGAFTAALIEGLRGEADYKKTGRITHKMLDLYITERVKTLTGGRQHPVTISPQGVPDFPFAAR